ncbi:MAG: sigma-54-dependent Fis family transcriptional regulator [Planctomycetaceae bacterium]|nr:sigma-54-dependent Fis family transcriptional regulator [Planctomycetaceae bacterium]
MKTVLVIDDEPTICWGFQNLFGDSEVTVLIAGSGKAGLEIARQNQVDLILLDIRLPDGSGLDFIEPLQAVSPNVSIIAMTAHGELEVAVEAVNKGVVDYLHKPFRLADALAACQRAFELGKQRTAPNTTAPTRTIESISQRATSLVGQSPAMQKVFHQIALVADSDLSVLIVGETGTGKELVAEAIVRHSRRSQQPFIGVAPVAYNPSLLESELFGHARGAFTGADQVRQGLFEAASGGTILLDEIGDLPLSAQVKLLRVLEQKTFSRVGETERRPCDVRVLAATNMDLKEAVQSGRFREDLLYRIGAVVLELPPLRERVDDIEPLVKHFLQQSGYDWERRGLSPAVVESLRQRRWPGNVRELRNAVQRAVVVARQRALIPSDFESGPTPASNHQDTSLPDAIQAWVKEALTMGDKSNASDHPADSGEPIYERFLSLAEPILFRTVLETLDGNRSAAADILGIHRATLRERLARYGIDDPNRR